MGKWEKNEIIKLAELLAEKYDKKYNNSGKISFEALSFPSDEEQELGHRLNQYVQNIQEQLKSDHRKILLLTQYYQNENLNHSVALIITSNLCLTVNTNGANPNPQNFLTHQIVIPVTKMLMAIDPNTGRDLKPIAIQASTKGCVIFSVKIAKHIAYLSDQELNDSIVKIENLKDKNGLWYNRKYDTIEYKNELRTGKDNYTHHLNFKKINPNILLNILKYSNSQTFNHFLLKFNGFSQQEIEKLYQTELNTKLNKNQKFSLKNTLEKYIKKHSQIINKEGKTANIKMTQEREKYLENLNKNEEKSNQITIPESRIGKLPTLETIKNVKKTTIQTSSSIRKLPKIK